MTRMIAIAPVRKTIIVDASQVRAFDVFTEQMTRWWPPTHTILKVTPTISAEGNSVMLKLSIESSTIGQKPAGAVDLVTNKRTITTNVLIEDGGVVVLGGLIEDNTLKGEQRVPFLGRIPLIGEAFRTRNAQSTKNNLMIFMRPKILRDQAQAAYETDLKYNYMMDEQRQLQHFEPLPLLPGVPRPTLPALPPPPPAGTQAAPVTPEEKARAAEEQRKANEKAAQPSTAPAPGTPAPQSNAAPATPPSEGRQP